MDIKKSIEGLGERKEEIIRKAMQCRSAEELLSLAKEYDIDLNQKQAAELLESMKKLSDDELKKVTGGADDQKGMSGMGGMGGMSGMSGMSGMQGKK